MEDSRKVYGHLDGGLYGSGGGDPAECKSIWQPDLLGDGAVSGGGWFAGNPFSGGSNGIRAGSWIADRLVFSAGRPASDDGGRLCRPVSRGDPSVPERVQKTVGGKEIPVPDRTVILSGVSDADGLDGGAAPGIGGRKGVPACGRSLCVRSFGYDGRKECPGRTFQTEE